jgi:acetolactate synthase-1/2/3 large subunit
MSFTNPDFTKYAQAYGARGTRVNTIGELRPTLEQAFADGGVHLVTVPVDYSENERVLVQELRQRLPVT